eukprot:227714-Chlamydomonas_euryale.AAC.1
MAYLGLIHVLFQRIGQSLGIFLHLPQQPCVLRAVRRLGTGLPFLGAHSFVDGLHSGKSVRSRRSGNNPEGTSTPHPACHTIAMCLIRCATCHPCAEHPAVTAQQRGWRWLQMIPSTKPDTLPASPPNPYIKEQPDDLGAIAKAQ